MIVDKAPNAPRVPKSGLPVGLHPMAGLEAERKWTRQISQGTHRHPNAVVLENVRHKSPAVVLVIVDNQQRELSMDLAAPSSSVTCSSSPRRPRSAGPPVQAWLRPW